MHDDQMKWAARQKEEIRGKIEGKKEMDKRQKKRNQDGTR